MTNPVQIQPANSSTPAATTATLSFALTNPITSGNGAVLAFTFGSVSGTPSLTSIIDDKGISYTVDQNHLDAFSGGSFEVIAHLLNITNGAQNITVTIANTVSSTLVINGCAYEIAGATSVDVTNTGVHASSASALIVAITTTNANEFAVVVDLSDVSTATWTQNNGWTQDNTSSFTGGYVFHSALAVPGANSLNMTPSTAVHSDYSYVAFRAAGAVVSSLSVSSLGPG